MLSTSEWIWSRFDHNSHMYKWHEQYFSSFDNYEVYLDTRCHYMFPANSTRRRHFFFFSMDIISPDLDSFRAAAVGVGVW